MKVLSFDKFNEKLNIGPIRIEDIDALPNNNINNDAEKIQKTIVRHCDYNGIGRDGIPTHMGDLLEEYGYECEYSIRPKEWDVDVSILEDKEVIKVCWVTQDFIDDNSLECLRQMFEEMVKISNVRGNIICFLCGVRDNYRIGGTPEHTMVYNPNTNKVEL